MDPDAQDFTAHVPVKLFEIADAILPPAAFYRYSLFEIMALVVLYSCFIRDFITYSCLSLSGGFK